MELSIYFNVEHYFEGLKDVDFCYCSSTVFMMVSRLKSVISIIVGLTVSVSFIGITSFSLRFCPE